MPVPLPLTQQRALCRRCQKQLQQRYLHFWQITFSCRFKESALRLQSLPYTNHSRILYTPLLYILESKHTAMKAYGQAIMYSNMALFASLAFSFSHH